MPKLTKKEKSNERKDARAIGYEFDCLKQNKKTYSFSLQRMQVSTKNSE